MGAKKGKVLEVVSGWEAVELTLKCIFVGAWQMLQIAVKRLWKGHRRKSNKNFPPVELTVDSSIGTHCYIKIMGVKYHYVETGPKIGQLVLILGDAPDSGLWSTSWTQVVRRLADSGYHVVTLDLRGTGGSETGSRCDLSPPRTVEELATLLEALGVSKNFPAIVIGFGIGGLLTWYLVHCHGSLVSKFAVIGAAHPNLYWQYPPVSFCNGSLYFIQWPHFPESWLAEGALHETENGKWSSSRACDWSGALNYVRGAAWWRVRTGRLASPPALLVARRTAAAQLVSSGNYTTHSTLRLVDTPAPTDPELCQLILDFLVVKDKLSEAEPRGLVTRMLGAVAGRGRDLTARLVLPTQAQPQG